MFKHILLKSCNSLRESHIMVNILSITSKLDAYIAKKNNNIAF